MGSLFSNIANIEAVAVVAGSFLSGTMMSLSLMAVPVFLATSSHPAQLFAQWLAMYNYGFPVLPTISIATCLLYVYIAVQQNLADGPWLVFAAAGVVTVAMVPFTWVFLWPVNETIMSLEEQARVGNGNGKGEAKGSAAEAGAEAEVTLGEAQRLVRLWSRIHFLRSFFPLIGAGIGLVDLLGHL